METDKQREESVSKHRREAWGAGPGERGLGRGTWGEESGERDLGRETWGRDMGRDPSGPSEGAWPHSDSGFGPWSIRADISVPRHPFVYFVTRPQETNALALILLLLLEQSAHA